MRFFLSRFKTWAFSVFACHSRSFKNQSELMERLSHELRTSLTGIVGYSEFVESSSTEPMVNFTAKIIRESSQGLARASNSFFDLHRLELGQIQIHSTTFSIIELVRDVVKLHQKQAREHHVDLFLNCSKDTLLLAMNSDAQIVRQVVDARVFGAVQSAGKGTSIHVDVSLDETKMYLQLMLISWDAATNGAQINLLQDFWSNDRYKFRLQEGPGVELALAKALIYFLHGQAEYRAASDELPQLKVKLPIRYSHTKVHV